MGNKLVASPFPSYESAVTCYAASDLAELKEKFSALRYVINNLIIRPNSFPFIILFLFCSDGLQTISLSTLNKVI